MRLTTTPIADSIGYRLRTFRQYRRITQQALAAYFHTRRIPITRDMLVKWETNRCEVLSKFLHPLADALRVSVLDLLPKPTQRPRIARSQATNTRRPDVRSTTHRK